MAICSKYTASPYNTHTNKQNKKQNAMLAKIAQTRYAKKIHIPTHMWGMYKQNAELQTRNKELTGIIIGMAKKIKKLQLQEL